MANNTKLGHNNRLPYFNGTEYIVWENKMNIFILGIDQDIWDIIEHGIIINVSIEKKIPRNFKRTK